MQQLFLTSYPQKLTSRYFTLFGHCPRCIDTLYQYREIVRLKIFTNFRVKKSQIKKGRHLTPGFRSFFLKQKNNAFAVLTQIRHRSGINEYRRFFEDKKKGLNQNWLRPFFYISGGADGVRTRDPRRDRPVF